ncbi:MAG: bacteriohemerythrin [Sulfurospirillaceae bacterium]|nr:bacteriohemerythrin [Sulfurospirillaceae bacterium]
MGQEWSRRFSLNHPVLDEQHKELFRLANCVEAMDARSVNKESLSLVIKKMFHYMREHFKEEEEYMHNIDYPLIQKHKKLHQDIIEAMTRILQETKGVEELQAKIKMLSHKWLVEHILESDLQIERWRLSNTVIANEEYLRL